MKSLTAFALVVLACVPAKAQLGGMGGMGGRPAAQAQSIEAEILEMQQEADKAALKEALGLQAREGMKPIRGAERQHSDEDAVALRDFIVKKKEAITARAAEILDKRTGGRRGPAAARAAQPPEGDKQDAVERYEKARIEVQLLQAQVNLLQPELTKAVEELADADIAASKDDTKREKAEAARKEYDKIKVKVVELNKRLYQEQQTVVPMQGQMQMMGMGGMAGGGFR
jgi:hypothetical protein